MRPRLIPVLLVKEGGLVKTVQFNNAVYIGDPINTIRLFNDMEVDEVIVLDIAATKNSNGPSYELIEEMASECFMPLCYGGGITNIRQVQDIFKMGVEKVAINQQALHNSALIPDAATMYGSQSIVGCLDIKRSPVGNHLLCDYKSNKTLSIAAIEYARQLVKRGVGELFINSVDNDGMMEGYDIPLIRELKGTINVPLIICGGAADLQDVSKAISAGADAAAAGSMFVFQGKQRGVLISYPSQHELDAILGTW